MIPACSLSSRCPRPRRWRDVVLVLAVACLAPAAAAQTCRPYWTRPATDWVGTWVNLAVFDDGAGPALWAASPASMWLTTQAPAPVIRWDGRSWSDRSTGIPSLSSIERFAVLDDGSGPRLHLVWSSGMAAPLPGDPVNPPFPCNGAFTSIWQSGAWMLGHPGLHVQCVGHFAFPQVTLDDGSGPAIFGTAANLGSPPCVARWSGAAWNCVGVPTGDVVRLFVHEDAAGPKLVASGSFTHIGGTPARNIAMWDGAAWHALGQGAGPVRALCTYDDGTGPALYVGGDYDIVIGQPSIWNIAKWDGVQWSDVGGGVGSPWIPAIQQVSALAVFDDGSGPALYAAGMFSVAGGVPARNIARWDGTRWSALGVGVHSLGVYSMAAYDGALYLGGTFTQAGGGVTGGLAAWVGCHGPCYADCNQDGLLNVADFTCFRARFAQQDPFADCTGDGLRNLADFGCFQTKFALACP